MFALGRRALSHFDWALMGVTGLLLMCGLVVLYSAGYDTDSPVNLFGVTSVNFPSAACLKQAVYVVAGFAVLLVGMSIPTQFFFHYAFLLYGVSILLLFGVAGFGVVVNGSRRWLDYKFEISRVISSGPNLVSRATTDNSSI